MSSVHFGHSHVIQKVIVVPRQTPPNGDDHAGKHLVISPGPNSQEPPRVTQSTTLDPQLVNSALIFKNSPKQFKTAEKAVSPGSSGSGGGSTVADGNNGFTHFKQGQTGDCAVLSAITSVANDKNGQQILEKSVTKNADGSYSVNFAGEPNKTYTVSAEEMKNDKLSSGNDKVRALEIAVKKHQEANGKQFEGSGGHDMIQLLTGKSTTNLKDQTNDPAQLKQKLLDIAKKDGNGLTMEIGASQLNGKSFGGMHGLTVTNIDANSGTVSYENPWDSSKIESMSLDNFVSDMTASGSGGIDYTEM